MDNLRFDSFGKVVNLDVGVVVVPEAVEGIDVALDVLTLSIAPLPVDFEPLVVALPTARSLVDATLEREGVPLAVVEDADFRMEDTPVPLPWDGDLNCEPIFSEKPFK